MRKKILIVDDEPNIVVSLEFLMKQKGYAVKVVNDAGFIYPEYAVCGFVEAGLKHMDVTNNSYYVDPFEFYCDDQPDQHAAKEAVRRAVELLERVGVPDAPRRLAEKYRPSRAPRCGTKSGCSISPTRFANGRWVIPASPISIFAAIR